MSDLPEIILKIIAVVVSVAVAVVAIKKTFLN
jgi:hypothetical protein